ncbi:MAG: inorganic phosphate transporter, partial [Campylobacterota bacterium]|nr:inorganic phosphate transporter [Campylobacterota bacterium]
MPQTSTLVSDNKLNLFFGLSLVMITAYFFFWGLDYTNHNHVLVFALATVFGVFMAFNIGGNDVANSFGTSVGAGTLTIKQALAIAAVFEVSGAVLAGGEVTKTIRKGIVDLDALSVEPIQFVYIMLSALLAAALWLLFATRRGWPVSTTHSIIGAIVGSSITLGIMLQGPSEAFSLVHWGQIGTIAVSWVLSPLLGGLASYFLYSMIKKHILDYNDNAAEKLKEVKKEKKAFKKEHKQYFKSISDIQKMAYTQEMARDAELMNEPEFDNEDLESDYYKKMHTIDKK